MPTPPGLSPKDSNQVLRAVMDDDTNRLRVDAVISPDGHDLVINHEDDSIAIGTSTELFTATDIGSKVGLDVNVINPVQIDVSSPISVLQDGTWTVQPGNTPNTTPWLVRLPDGTEQPTVTTSFTSPGQTLTMLSNGASSVSVQVTGTWSGLIAAYVSNDGVTWENIPFYLWFNGSLQTFIGDTHAYSFQNAGFKYVQLKAIVIDSGPAEVNVWLGPMTPVTMVVSQNPAAMMVTSNTRDGAGNALTSTGAALDVNLKTSDITLPVSGTINANVLSTVLPPGASTSALQTTANGSLASIDTKLTSPLVINVKDPSSSNELAINTDGSIKTVQLLTLPFD